MTLWRGTRAPAVAAIGAAAALVAALGGPAAQGGTFVLALSKTGSCVPAPTDSTAILQSIHAVGIPPTPTRPIAILDTGVAPVPELAGRVMPGVDALSGAPVDGDADGHGTMAAGLAAGAGPGVAGLSPGSPILPVRIFPNGHESTADAVAKGIAAAVQRGAGVISIDGFGPLADATPSEVLAVTKAIGDAAAKGVVVVAAGGDGDSTQGVIPQLPGSLPHVLTATAGNATGAPSITSVPGPWVDALLPVQGVTAPLPGWCNLGYGFGDGTSLAAPVLAGSVALVQARRPDLTAGQLFTLVRRSADDLLEAGRDNASGFGMLDVAKALSSPPLPKEASAEVDDDPYWLRGPYAKAHRTLLTSRKLRFKVSGSVSAAKDPSDVYRVRLLKGEHVTITVKPADPASLLELSLLSSHAGDFDVSDGVDRNRVRATGGVSNFPQLTYTAKRAGTYYVAVETSDAFDPDDPSGEPLDQEPYLMSAVAHRKKVKRHHKPKKAKHRTKRGHRAAGKR